MADKHYFSPVPNRAFFDDRLGKMHLRVLGAVAMHDRMGANGRHCLLSVRRLADKLDIDFSNCAKAIRELAEWGYLQRLANPEHRQRVQLSIVYDDATDLASISRNRGSTVPRSDGGDRGSTVPHIIYSPEGDRIYAAQAASVPIDGTDATQREKPQRDISEGEYLARMDRSLRAQYPFSPDELVEHYQALGRIMISHGGHAETPIGGWAYRISEDLSALMDQKTWRRTSQ